jgi:two-component system phosphate regulon sensor histidine kinase PhoR
VEARVVALVAVIALAVVTFMALREWQARVRLERAAGATPGNDAEAAVVALRERAVAAELESALIRNDQSDFVRALELGVMIVDEDLRIVGANPAAHTLLGVTPGSLPGRTLIGAFITVHAESLAREALAVGSATEEILVAGVDGPRLVLRARRVPSGGLWLVVEDVTELRRLQQIRTEFIDNLSHELRTPLTTVSLLAETLTREADTVGDAIPPRMRDRIDKIEVETGHLVQMVNELLDLSRIESGATLGAMDLVDIGRVAVESTERLRLFADRQGVILRVDVPESTPRVRGDEDRLGQVVVNLLHNAVKFSPDGGEVVVAAHATPTDVIVSLADHGVGIPRAAQARIFERFYKVDRARFRGGTGGTGLGLAISRHIIEQHGGRIWVESTEGVGSTFSFSLPIAPPPP